MWSVRLCQRYFLTAQTKIRDNKPFFFQLTGHANKLRRKSKIAHRSAAIYFHERRPEWFIANPTANNVRRWPAAAAHDNGKCPQDLKREAAAAWRRFVSCVRALPPDQAAPLWQAVLGEATSMAHI